MLTRENAGQDRAEEPKLSAVQKKLHRVCEGYQLAPPFHLRHNLSAFPLLRGRMRASYLAPKGRNDAYSDPRPWIRSRTFPRVPRHGLPL